MSARHVLGAGLAALVGFSITASTATAAQREYRITSGTTTITLDNRWLDTLQSSGVRVSAGQGAQLTIRKPKDAARIVRLVFHFRVPPRTQSANLLFYGTSQGTLLTVNHGGTVTFTSSDQPGSITFRRPVIQVADPPVSVGSNRLEAEIVRPTVRGNERFVDVPRMRIPRPRDGIVTLRMTNVRFDNHSGLLNGSDPLSPPGSADWFPTAAKGANMGDVLTVLHVKRRS